MKTMLMSEVFEIINLGEYHDLYVQSDTLLLADVFENLEVSVLKYMNLILLSFCLHQDQHRKHLKKTKESLKKTKVKLEYAIDG